MCTTEKWDEYQKRRSYMNGSIIPLFRQAQIEPRRVKQLEDCGKFINTIECDSCNASHYSSYRRCKSRWCSCCNHTRSLQWFAKLYPVVEDWLNKGNYAFMMNFTVKDTVSLHEGLDLLQSSFRKMTNGNKAFREWWYSRYAGGLRSLEIKLGENSRNWHPHLHCLVLTDRIEKDYEFIKENWKYHTQRYYGGLFTEYKDGVKVDVGSVWMKGIKKENFLESVTEIIKYIVKFEGDLLDMLGKSQSIEGYPNKLNEMVYEMTGKRQINTWGILRGLDDRVEEEIEKTDEKKLTEFICQLCGCDHGTLKTLIYGENEKLYDC
jgi:plasmid rolling circle replication initiator protein Rep